MKEFKHEFSTFDINGDGTIDPQELLQILQNLGESATEASVNALIAEVDQDGNGVVDFPEFLAVISAIRTGNSGDVRAFAKVYEKQRSWIQVKGFSGVHSFAEEEMAAFANHLNRVLGNDEDLAYLMPINPEGLELAEKIGDGVLLSKFINLAVPGTIDERAINKKKDGRDLSVFKVNENLNLVVASATAIGCQTINLGSTELANGPEYPHLVLGLLWQLVKLHLLNSINLKSTPELVRLLEEGETLEDLLKLSADQLLIRWFNYHLAKQGSSRRVRNFGPDVKDSECYTILLNSISPSTCDLAALNESDPRERARHVLRNAEALGVDIFITPDDIANGNPKLNLAFTAAIFNCNPGLEELAEEEALELAGLMDDDFGDSREERAFRMWMNSLGIDGLYINNLYDDCGDAIALLKVMDFVEPGCVDWSNVEMNPRNKFAKLGNANYCVDVGKELGFSLVGIGGVDIVDGNKKLILAIVWQLMRRHTIKFLSELTVGGEQVTEEQIIEWANKKVADAGRPSSMNNFRDESLSTSHFFFDLLYAVESRIIDWDLVTPAENEEDALLNARYAISVARKLNCTIFLLPEDIVEVKDKMIMTFVAAIMAVALAMNAGR
jgi:plastin-1